MRLHLVRLESEKSWARRGYANHLHLIVDYNKKEFVKFISHGTGWNDNSTVEVKRKIEIEKYVDFLKSNGFIEVNN